MKKIRENGSWEKKETIPILYNSAGLINQTPIQEKPNAYIRKTKTVQFIYIIEKVGLMNQAPTEESNSCKNDQTVGLINQTPT
jgi:hypothetical protein